MIAFLVVLVLFFALLSLGLGVFLIISFFAFKNVDEERRAYKVLIINFIEGGISFEAFKQTCKNLNIYSEPIAQPAETTDGEVWEEVITEKNG